MGNTNGTHRRRNAIHAPPNGHPPVPAPHPPEPEISNHGSGFHAPPPYPAFISNRGHNPPQYYPFAAYYAPPSIQLPLPHDRHQRGASLADAAYPNWNTVQSPQPQIAKTPAVEHQKAITIRNDVNLKKETLAVEPEEDNPGKHVVTFIFDATVGGSITIAIFAKEDANCNLIPTKQGLEPVTVSFCKGLGQRFRQPSGTGIDFSLFKEEELAMVGNCGEIYPLAVKAEVYTCDDGHMEDNNPKSSSSQITHAVFEKDQGLYRPRVVKQILWIDSMRYELQEIYGIGNSVDSDYAENELGKECVICLSEPRDTTVLPCRHMCMCSGCAKVLLGSRTSRCPICRQPVERLLEIKVNNKQGGEDGVEYTT